MHNIFCFGEKRLEIVGKGWILRLTAVVFRVERKMDSFFVVSGAVQTRPEVSAGIANDKRCL